jgi:cytidylate kinase
MKPNIAIDGPAGAGKSTVARKLAERLDYLYIDTGAMYRAVAYAALKEGIDLDSEEELGELAGQLNIELRTGPGNCQMVLCNGEDITSEIRTQAVSRAVSAVAKVPAVRYSLVDMQRRMAAKGGVVMDGRDIGSYVLPEAHLKLFVTASLEERTRRRFKDLEAQGYKLDFEELKNEIQERDLVDSSRQMAPLKKVPEAVLVDSTDMTEEQVIEYILDIYRQRFGA